MNSFNYDFKIPLKRDDLRRSETPNQYVVSDIVYFKDLKSKIEECKLSVREIGCDFVLEHFDTIFSVLQNLNELDFEVLISFYENTIAKGLDQLFNTLNVIFDNEDLHCDLRLKMLNITKMILYVTVEFLKSFQEKIDKTYSLVINEKGKKNTKMTKLKEDHDWDWEESERLTLYVMKKIIGLSLQKLWNPPMPEEEFVRMIADCCYNVLEKPAITSLKMKSTRETVIEILAILIKHYNNAISCKVKIVQLLKLCDHLTSILAQAVVLFVEKYNCRSLVKELILEIIETESEAEAENYTQDGSSSRAFSNFIVEIAKQRPEIILPCINLLIHNLSCDPYSMRICVLTVMAEIIISVFDAEGQTEEKRKIRDNYLNHLLDHIVDCNVFVRSRVLKLWQGIYRHKAIPTSYVILVLESAIERLSDKSNNVVKNAVQLITLMLEENLYGALLDAEPVKQNLRTVKSKLIEAENAKRDPSVFKIWFYSRMDISDFIAKNLTESHSVDGNSDSELNEEEDSGELSETEISNELQFLQKQVLSQNFKNIFEELSNFERKYIKRLKILKTAGNKVQYYEWILGNLCKKDVNVRLDVILRFAKCENYTTAKPILNEPIQIEDPEDIEFNTDKNIVIYCEDYLRFIQTMSSAAKVIGELMMNRTSSEVLEAISFFRAAQQFCLTGSEEGVRNMLLLINSKEPGFKEAVKNTFKILYLESKRENKYDAAIEAVDKLIILLKKVTHEQKSALKNLIKEWVAKNDIGNEFILVLWEKYSKKAANVSYEDSVLAAALISMYASEKPEIIKSNMDMLIKYGLSSENYKNYAFQKYTFQMFSPLFGLKNKNGSLTKFAPESELFEKLNYIIHDQFFNLENELYPESSMEAITIIYQLAEHPDTICENMLKILYKKLRLNESDDISIKEEILARFILIVGHISFCQWQYLETHVLTELKHRNLQSKAKVDNRKAVKDEKNKSHSTSVVQKSVAENMTNHFEDDSEALINERIAETVSMVCEKELLYGETLLAKFSSLIVYICKNPTIYSGERLRSAASLSLSKLMMISSEFCSSHLQIFVTMLERAAEPEVKLNLILAFGDLTFRFPNTVEPWTMYYYNRLNDRSVKVRYTALIVISHLITNEMVKVKSQMSDVALCLVDEDQQIKSHAFQLFYELSLKGNTLYNVMADIISRLSHPDHRADEETFQTILKILMKLITKDRHLESIVEKLCYRLRGAVDERQCIDLSYCLTLIRYSERCLQKLLDNLACYADKLEYKKVQKYFATIIAGCKKMKTNKISEIVAELENKISIVLTKGVDNLEADFLKPPKTPMKTPLKTPLKTPKTKNGSTTNISVTSTKQLRSRPVKKKISFSSDDEDDQ